MKVPSMKNRCTTYLRAKNSSRKFKDTSSRRNKVHAHENIIDADNEKSIVFFVERIMTLCFFKEFY